MSRSVPVPAVQAIRGGILKKEWQRDALGAGIFLLGVHCYFWQLLTPNVADRAVLLLLSHSAKFKSGRRFAQIFADKIEHQRAAAS